MSPIHDAPSPTATRPGGLRDHLTTLTLDDLLPGVTPRPFPDEVREPGGASATVETREGETVLVIRDRTGTVAVEFDPRRGRALLHPSAGDLEVRVPGSMRLAAGGRLDLAAEEGISLRTPGALEVRADRARVAARDGEWTGQRLKLHVGDLLASVQRLRGVLDTIHTTADRSVSRVREKVSSVRELFRLRAGRVEARVVEDVDLWSDRASLRSRGRFRVDGKEIHLG
jgi:hypothetical protein